MAEIKSTMELVLERAARIGKASSEDLRRDEARKKGVQLAVEYLEGNLDDPLAAIKQEESGAQLQVLRGLGETLLRNIALARDEIQQERVDKAVRGVISLEGGSAEIQSICHELANIIGGYRQHREQLQEQLEEQIRMQYEQLMAQQPELQNAGIRIDPTQQPKFKEEWGRIQGELDSQYNRALDQLKAQIGQRLGMQ